MPWVRIDDRFATHPKVVASGPLAMAMQVAALCYCNRELTDGFVPRAVARTLLDWQIEDKQGDIYVIGVSRSYYGQDVECQWVIDILVECGMWTAEQGGYRIHDYLDYQPSREQVLAERENNARRQSAWRNRDKPSTNTMSNADSNAVTDGATNGSVTGAPVPVPVPITNPERVSKRESANAPKLAIKKATRLPDDFAVTPEMFAWSSEIGMSSLQTLDETARFKDYYLAVPGQKGLKLDWVSTWRNWIRRSKEMNANGSPVPLRGRRERPGELTIDDLKRMGGMTE
jgi:hypothetical protein